MTTLSTHVNFLFFDFNNCKLRIVSFSIKLETGAYVRTKKSLEPYLSFSIFLNILISPSNKSSLKHASRLKFLPDKMKKNNNCSISKS